jgi:hypothetical protein
VSLHPALMTGASEPVTDGLDAGLIVRIVH